MEAAVPPPIHSDKKFPDVIELNVGGKRLTTTLETLRKEPDSMLASMFSGRHTVRKDENDRFFIDCDAKMFGYVLNYLRSGSLPPGEMATVVYDMAMYFGIQSLVERLKNFHSVQYRKKINNLKQELQAEEYEKLKQDAIQGINMYTVSPAEYKTFHVTKKSCESPDCVHNEKSTFEGRESPSKQNILVVTGYTASHNMVKCLAYELCQLGYGKYAFIKQDCTRIKGSSLYSSHKCDIKCKLIVLQSHI